MSERQLQDDWTVTVCDKCERACCWQGEFMCDYARLAGVKKLTIGELRTNPRGEHEEYWRKDVDVWTRLTGNARA